MSFVGGEVMANSYVLTTTDTSLPRLTATALGILISMSIITLR